MSARWLPGLRITRVWLLLLAVTGLSWGLGRVGGDGAFRDRRNVGVLIIALAFYKIRLVLLDFMELRRAPPAMRYAGELWVVVLAGAILAIYRL